MTELWREFRTVSIVGVMTAGVIVAFPLSALDFKAKVAPSSVESSAAFIELTIDEEVLALKAAKSAWQSESSAMQRMRVRLPIGELPEEEVGVPLELSDANRFFLAEPTPLAYPLPTSVRSQAAASPMRLIAEPDDPPMPTFSRSELLNLK